MTPDSDGITFEIDGIARGDSGLLEVSGRWFGVRGRRFVRPTLTVTLPGGDGEIRLLADLEHKPWAAEEGDPWRAGFAFEGELDQVAAAELNVAPDITVQLGAPGAGTARSRAAARAASPSAATGARTPVIRDNPARPRPRVPRTAEVQRLHERLAAAEAATTKERTRRDAAETALEQERGTARKLQAELGRLRAEHELAETMQSELDTASTSLDRLRRDLRELGRERDEIRAERDDAQQALAALRADAQSLRGRLTDAEAAVRRLTQAGREARVGAAQSAQPTAPPAARAGSPAVPAAPATRTGEDAGPTAPPEDDGVDRIGFAPAAESGRGAEPLASTEPFEPLEPTERIESTEPMRFPVVAAPGPRDRGGPERSGPAPTPRRERPLNPSQRGPNWVGRGIALVVLIMVILALVLLISSTGH